MIAWQPVLATAFSSQYRATLVKRLFRRLLLAIAAILLLAGGGAAIYACVQTHRYDESMDKVYAVEPLPFRRSTDAAVVARGKHLAESIAGCTVSFCHDHDLGGGETFSIGPLATFTAPNISPGGIGAAYSDGELARLIRHGVKKDGRSVRFMPAQDFGWLPDSDVIAVVSYLRSVPPVDRPNGVLQINMLGKLFDRRDGVPFDIARRIDHDRPDLGPTPSATADYGRYVARMCSGCHGTHFSGGPLPGAPSSFPVPLNLTPHETGIKSWSYEDFDKLLTQAVRKNGQKLQEFMPTEATAKMDDTEKRAVFAYFQSLPPTPYGNR
jgi:hypothetical protein